MLNLDLPPMVEFKKKADAIIQERWGIEVEHISKKSYEHYFYKRRGFGKSKGQIYGFPMTKGAWCNDRLKTRLLDKCKGRNCISYLGIADDEPNRFHNLTDTKRSPLVGKDWTDSPTWTGAGWTEAMCREWCEKNDLLSPIYTTAARGGVLVLPQSVRQPTAPVAPQLSRILGADAQMGCRQPSCISCGRPHRPRF